MGPESVSDLAGARTPRATARPRAASTPQTVSVAALFERSYRDYADRIALVDGDRQLTYRELGERAHAFARALTGLGLQPGDRVALLSGNRAEFVEADQGLFTGGFVRVALSVRLHLREIVHILAHSGARAVVADAEWSARLASVRDELTALEQVIALDGGEGLDFEQLVAAGTAAGTAPGAAAAALPAADDVAALLYTSGTTGLPKGATLTQGNWAAMIRNSLVELPPVDETDIVLHVAPLSHFSGYVAPTYFTRGARHVILRRFEPVEVLAALGEHRITTLPLVPTMLNQLLLAAEEIPFDSTSLRTIVYGASAIAPDRLARAVRAFGDVFIQVYGLSETPMPLTALSQRDHSFDPAEPPPARLASAGRPSPFVELKIVGADGVELATGEVGEIVVRGDVVMLGYWNDPQATAGMIDADGWAATGDLGRRDSDGYVTIVDRKGDMIVSGGYNLYPGEIENVISTLVEVQEVAIVGVPDERWGEAVKAIVVIRPGHALTAEQVVAVCHANLASYKKPLSVDFVDELPKTGSGKILRRSLRERYWQGLERRVGG